MTARTPLWQRAAAAAGLVVTAPVIGAAALVIACSDRGPILYRASRAGVGGRPFIMYKFRTMRLGSDAAGAITAGSDARVFPAGRWLRRFKIDELPQLVNVLIGNMAIVGPRPEAMSIVREHYLPWMMETLDVPPGITGVGSLHYIEQERLLPSDPTDAARAYVQDILPRKLSYELIYLRSRSLRYDLQLIFRTLTGASGLKLTSTAVQAEAASASSILAEVSRESAR